MKQSLVVLQAPPEVWEEALSFILSEREQIKKACMEEDMFYPSLNRMITKLDWDKALTYVLSQRESMLIKRGDNTFAHTREFIKG